VAGRDSFSGIMGGGKATDRAQQERKKEEEEVAGRVARHKANEDRAQQEREGQEEANSLQADVVRRIVGDTAYANEQGSGGGNMHSGDLGFGGYSQSSGGGWGGSSSDYENTPQVCWCQGCPLGCVEGGCVPGACSLGCPQFYPC
jgi:hypothetical protein